jgi:hypothetical protein
VLRKPQVARKPDKLATPMGEQAKLSDVRIAIDFGVFKLETRWTEDPRQKNAAWALYVELVTRIATQDIDLEHGLMREALDSLYSLFGVTREVLSREGPVVGMGPTTVGGIAVRVLNQGIRPFLAKWHPRLCDWEARREPTTSARAHERAWPDEAKCRGELAKLQKGLEAYAQTLGKIAGAV